MYIWRTQRYRNCKYWAHTSILIHLTYQSISLCMHRPCLKCNPVYICEYNGTHCRYSCLMQTCKYADNIIVPPKGVVRKLERKVQSFQVQGYAYGKKYKLFLHHETRNWQGTARISRCWERLRTVHWHGIIIDNHVPESVKQTNWALLLIRRTYKHLN